jgi:hypothetical protein
MSKTNINNNTNTSKNLLKVLVLIMLVNTKKNLHVQKTPTTQNIHGSLFHLPQKKKSVIFLRAPYKNKLARLNILNLEFTSVVSLSVKTHVTINNLNTISDLGDFSFDTHKIKNVKTKVKFTTSAATNFSLFNFN